MKLRSLFSCDAKKMAVQETKPLLRALKDHYFI